MNLLVEKIKKGIANNVLTTSYIISFNYSFTPMKKALIIKPVNSAVSGVKMYS